MCSGRWSIARNRQRAVQRDEVDVKNVDTGRDSSLERLMKDALRSRMPEVSDTSDTSRCLSAETLAAWSEQTLSAREREAAEAHAADCARCQAMLATMVRITPVPVKTPWWRVHMMAWMVPVTAATAALVVWLAIPGERAVAPREAMTRAEPTPLAAPATPPAPTAAPRAVQSELANELAKKENATSPAPSGPRGDAMKELKLEQSRQKSPAREESRRADANEKPASVLDKMEPLPQAQPKAAQEVAAAPPPAAAVPAAPAPAALPAPAAAAPPPAAVAAEPPGDRRAFATGGAAGAVAQRAERDMLASRVANAAAAPIVSPNPQNRWRIVTGGAVEHSTDGGATWQRQQTGETLTLTAGAAPAPTVCWVVGPRGRVVISTDGASWKQVPVAEPIDLVAVRATNDKTATVTAADGRTFTTVDGGATWTR
jgi:hypothetical protein